MRNLMTLRGMRTLIFAAALGAACGGGDPPGGGNGDTDGGDTTDGTTGNGGTDGHVPNPNNPLIAVIPGTWELYEVNSQDGRGWREVPSEERQGGSIAVDPSDPDCTNGARTIIGPPGDACIDWITGLEPLFFILDGDNIRADYRGPQPYEGRVLEGGRRIEYGTQPDLNGVVVLLGFRKLD